MKISSDSVWYFFYPVTYKNPKSKPKMMNKVNDKRKPINRATKEGKWKPSGNPVKVRARDSNKQIGIKRHLYFFISEVNKINDNRSKVKTTNSYHKKTPWILYEYELTDVHPSLQVSYFLLLSSLIWYLFQALWCTILAPFPNELQNFVNYKKISQLVNWRSLPK